MSEPNRISGTADFEEAPRRERSFDWSVTPGPVSDENRSGMRTIDRPPGGDGEKAAPLERKGVLDRAAFAIHHIQCAAREKTPYGGSGLAFFTAKNNVTGGEGVVVRRWLGHGFYTRPLAEVLAPSARPEDGIREAADLLTHEAFRGRLKINLNEDAGAADPRYVAFVAIPWDPKEDGHVRLLARVFVTAFEVSQWRDPLIETDARGVN